MNKKEQAKLLEDVIRRFDEDHTEHRERVVEYESRYKSYRAMREFQREARQEREGRKPLPAYVFQSVETMVANTLEANPRWRLHVHPQMAAPERMEMLLAGAEANEALLRHQLSLDKWPKKQRPFDLQGLILGLTGSKQSWNYRTGPRRSLEREEIPQYDDYGMETEPKVGYREITDDEFVYRDDPTSEVVDMRHLIFQKGATNFANSERVTHRVYKSIEALRRQECQVAGGKFHQGPCTPGRFYHNLDQISESDGGPPHEDFQHEQDLHGERPHISDIEILEHWYRVDNTVRVCTVAARKVLIGERTSPFWFEHLEHPFPFVVCSGTPDLFRIPGISEVEMMAEIQRMLWMLIEQRLTNLELVNNAIMLIADDVIDPDEFEVEPGARFLVPRPLQETVQWWSPDVKVADLSMQAEALLKGDLQDVTGGMPFLAGTQSQTVDQETATGVSIVTSLAQKRLAAKRQQYIWAKAEIGEQWCALNQQFIRAERKVPIMGQDGVEAFLEIQPELIQGVYLFETEMAEESLMRQEKRAEAQAKLQTAGQLMAPMAMGGAPLNMKAFMDDYLESFGVEDKDRYYSQQQPLPSGVAPAAGGEEPASLGGGEGITNEALAAGPTSPSNETSMSPEAAMQQFMSSRGTAN